GGTAHAEAVVPARTRRCGISLTGRTHPMNAIPASLLEQTEQLSSSVTRPIPGSRKIHVDGSLANTAQQPVRVPMREITLTRTPTIFGGEENAPVTVYDTSGPYTDPDARIDLGSGLPAVRAQWIAARGDTEELA